MTSVRYPFEPKSTAFLEPGQFWGIVPDRWLSHGGGGTVWVYQGATRLHPGSAADADLPIVSMWGYSVIAVIAEHVLVEGKELSSGSNAS